MRLETDMNYPDDADGDALRRVAQDGSDMTKPMDIDFAIAASDEHSANAIAQAAQALGYGTDVFRGDNEGWSCYCTRTMLATYDGVVRVQAALDALSRPLGGYADGWGTFGNGPQRTNG
jgi:hypothetical protein